MPSAGEGDDHLEGGDGRETLLGGAGDDLFIGDGRNTLLGGGDGNGPDFSYETVIGVP